MMIMIDGYDLQASATSRPKSPELWSLDIAAFGVVFAAGLGGTIRVPCSPGRQRAVRAGAVLKMSLLVFGVGRLRRLRPVISPNWRRSAFIVGVGLAPQYRSC